MFFKLLAFIRGGNAAFLVAVAALVLCSSVIGVRYPGTHRKSKSRKGALDGCQIRKYLHYGVEVPGCKPQVLSVRGCFGVCQTFEVPILLPPHKLSKHKMCSYAQVQWRTVELSDCDPGVNRTYMYHDAVRCRCRRCNPADTYCAGV